MWQSTMTSSMVGPRNSKVLPETKLAQKKDIESRNEITSKIARDNEVGFFDLFKLMKEKGGTYSYKDWIHFEQRANAFIAYEILAYITNISGRLNNEAAVARKKLCSKLTEVGEEFFIYDNSDTIYWLLKYLGMTEQIKGVLKQISEDSIVYGIQVKELGKVTAEDRKEYSVLVENRNEEELLQKMGYKQLHLLSKVYK